ncbi:MAG: hypothetical protein PHR68_02250 [Candidatus Gracilibacteria bacterium]|nr:hypothetical protein [Candidatus Gracilibacteria bacterium]
MKNISKNLIRALWEYDIDKLKFSDSIVIERTLSLGEISDYLQIEKNIGKERIINFFMKNIDKFDKKTSNYWLKIFDIRDLKSNNISLYEQMNTAIFRRSFR